MSEKWWVMRNSGHPFEVHVGEIVGDAELWAAVEADQARVIWRPEGYETQFLLQAVMSVDHRAGVYHFREGTERVRLCSMDVVTISPAGRGPQPPQLPQDTYNDLLGALIDVSPEVPPALVWLLRTVSMEVHMLQSQLERAGVPVAVRVSFERVEGDGQSNYLA